MDLEQIESLLKLMQTYQVASLEVEEGGTRIKLDMSSPAAAAVAYAAPALVAPAAPAAAPATAPAPAASSTGAGELVKSPMVGTFYESPKPGQPPFVTVGSRVKKGDVLCIVEAMKLMNELESDVSGVVAEILVANAQPVQFGQPLYRITPA